MELLKEIKQLELYEGTRHTLVDTSTKKELNIEVKNTSELRKFEKVTIITIALFSILLVSCIISLICGCILTGASKEQALGAFAVAIVFTTITGLLMVITCDEEKMPYGMNLALKTCRKLQKLISQANFKDEMFIEFTCTNIDGTLGDIQVQYFDRENNKEFKSITFRYADVCYEKDLKSPKLIVDTAESSGIQLHLPLSECKNYERLKERKK